MQPDKNTNNKPPAPARSTIFYVHSVGASPIDNNTYALGVALNIDNNQYEPMAVRLSDENELAEYYGKIYEGQAANYIKGLASSEVRMTNSNSTRNDYSIKGVVRNTIESGVLHAAKKQENIDLNDLSSIDFTMFDDIKGRFVLALDNLEVTHEGDINGVSTKIGRATRAQALSIHSNTAEHSVVQALGYVDYIPPYLAKDNQHKVKLKTFEGSSQSTIAQLAGENKHKMLETMQAGLNNKLDAYGLPNAERNGTLDIQINFLNEHSKKEEYSLSLKSYIDLSTHYNKEIKSYIPRVDGDKFINSIVEGADYHTALYNKHLAGKAKEPMPADLIEQVAKHDFVRFLHKSITNYDEAMQGNYIQALKDEDRWTSEHAINLGRVQDLMVQRPDNTYLSFQATTDHMIHSVPKRELLAVKNSEFVQLLKDKNVPDEVVQKNTVGRIGSTIKSLNSAVLSNIEKDVNGIPKKADIVSPVMFSLVQVKEDSNAVVRLVRGLTATPPAYPQMKKIETVAADGFKQKIFMYDKDTPSFVSSKILPDGAAEKNLQAIETANAHNSKYNPLNIERNTIPLDALKTNFRMTPNLSLVADSERGELMMLPMPLPEVSKPYYFNAPVKPKDVNKSAMVGNKNDLLTNKQKQYISVILGNYVSQKGQNTAQGQAIERIFNTPYKRARVSEFLDEAKVRYPNFFMDKKTAEQHGFDVYGGYNVAKGLLDTPYQPLLNDPDNANDKYTGMNIYKEYGDVLRSIVQTNISDSELKRSYAPAKAAAEKANIHTAIPTAADTQSAKIDNLYPKAALGNEATSNDLNALFGVGNKESTVTTPRLPTESEKMAAVPSERNERSVTASQIMRRL